MNKSFQISDLHVAQCCDVKCGRFAFKKADEFSGGVAREIMLAKYGCRWGWYWCRYSAILALRLSIGERRCLHKDSTREDRKKIVEEIGDPRGAISEPISQQRNNMARRETVLDSTIGEEIRVCLSIQLRHDLLTENRRRGCANSDLLDFRARWPCVGT